MSRSQQDSDGESYPELVVEKAAAAPDNTLKMLDACERLQHDEAWRNRWRLYRLNQPLLRIRPIY
jgi:hypothetical protein